MVSGDVVLEWFLLMTSFVVFAGVSVLNARIILQYVTEKKPNSYRGRRFHRLRLQNVCIMLSALGFRLVDLVVYRISFFDPANQPARILHLFLQSVSSVSLLASFTGFACLWIESALVNQKGIARIRSVALWIVCPILIVVFNVLFYFCDYSPNGLVPNLPWTVIMPILSLFLAIALLGAHLYIVKISKLTKDTDRCFGIQPSLDSAPKESLKKKLRGIAYFCTLSFLFRSVVGFVVNILYESLTPTEQYSIILSFNIVFEAFVCFVALVWLRKRKKTQVATKDVGIRGGPSQAIDIPLLDRNDMSSQV
eukprot:ANDGO_00291.mRNA.1 hypothetical protein